MRPLFCLSSLFALLLVLTACHSAPPPQSSGSSPSPANPPAASSDPVSMPVASQSSSQASSAPSSTTAPRPHPASVPKNAPQIAQLDLDSEGGTRDGSYAMWVHVSEDGKPVPNLRVLAYNSANHIAASARTNEDGDARLLVQIAGYRIAASRGKLHAEQTVAYHPGDQYDLQLTR